MAFQIKRIILSLNAAMKQLEQVKAERFSHCAQEVRKLVHQTEEALDHILGQVSIVQDMIVKFEQSFSTARE